MTPFVRQLLGDAPVADIIGGSWLQQPSVLRGGANAIDGRISMADVPGLVAQASLDSRINAFAIRRDGKLAHDVMNRVQAAARDGQLDMERLDAMLEGATVVVNAIGRYGAGPASALRDLFDGFAEFATMNLYYSPPGGAAGLGVHFDRWEIFAAHLHGAKHWRLWEPTQKFPIEDRSFQSDEVSRRPPTRELVVEAPDVLYLPRGHWHLASPTDQPSLHLTLGVHVKKGLDVAFWLADALSKEERWRRNMPVSVLPGGGGAQLAEAQQAVERLRELLDQPDAAKQFLAYQFRREYVHTFGLEAGK